MLKKQQSANKGKFGSCKYYKMVTKSKIYCFFAYFRTFFVQMTQKATKNYKKNMNQHKNLFDTK